MAAWAPGPPEAPSDEKMDVSTKAEAALIAVAKGLVRP